MFDIVNMKISGQFIRCSYWNIFVEGRSVNGPPCCREDVVFRASITIKLCLKSLKSKKSEQKHKL